ncbi:MAG: hypothetical protein M0Q13_14010 [Methanothrix sp.]|jgi:Fe-S-cluster containining protein|nr:hypothetical protein [Methanothrix sp.]
MKKNKNKKRGIVVDFIDSFEKIKKVHKNIPNFDFDCKNCKKNCCVSPYISIIEFIYVTRYIIKNFEKPNEILFKDNGRNSDGILLCPFLTNEKMCLIYPVRHYKCRMTGMDILDDIFTDVCEHKKELKWNLTPTITKQDWYSWIELLTKANKSFNYDDQRTFQSWLRFCFQEKEKLNNHEIAIQDLIKNYLNIDNYIPYIDANDFL